MMNIKQFLELTWVKVIAIKRSEDNKTYLGNLWWFIQPLLFMAIYYVVFGIILRNKTKNFMAFLLIGILSFRWFSQSVMAGVPSIDNAKALIKQTKVPKPLFPLSHAVYLFWKFLYVFIVYTFIISFFNIHLSEKLIAIPVLFIVQFTFILGITLPLAAIHPVFPDLNNMLELILRCFFFLSGIFFSASKIPEEYKFYFYLNPLANLIEDYRNIIIYNNWPDWSALLIIFSFSASLIILGLIIIKKLEYTYIKYFQ